MPSFCDCYRPVIERPLALMTAILIHVLGMIGRFLASAFSHPCARLFRLGTRLCPSRFCRRPGFRDSLLDFLFLLPLQANSFTNRCQFFLRCRIKLGPSLVHTLCQPLQLGLELCCVVRHGPSSLTHQRLCELYTAVNLHSRRIVGQLKNPCNLGNVHPEKEVSPKVIVAGPLHPFEF
jgi:hypothetical protein